MYRSLSLISLCSISDRQFITKNKDGVRKVMVPDQFVCKCF